MGVRGSEDVKSCHGCALQPPRKPWDLSQRGVQCTWSKRKAVLEPSLFDLTLLVHIGAGSTGGQQTVQTMQVYFLSSALVSSLKLPEPGSTEATVQTLGLHTTLMAAYINKKCLQDLCSFRSELVLLVSAGLPDKKRWFTWMGGELQFFCNEFIINTVRDRTKQFQIHKSSVFLLISVFFGTLRAVSVPLERLFHNAQ